jgi:mutator protein MutT
MRWTVSVKGVVMHEARVLLAFNDREEWELPGGQLEDGESPEECVAREIIEEAGLAVSVVRLLSTWVFEVVPGRRVLIVAYLCELISPAESVRASDEHSVVAFVPLSDLNEISLPDGYRAAIRVAEHTH